MEQHVDLKVFKVEPSSAKEPVQSHSKNIKDRPVSA